MPHSLLSVFQLRTLPIAHMPQLSIQLIRLFLTLKGKTASLDQRNHPKNLLRNQWPKIGRLITPSYMRGVNRGMQIRRSVLFFSSNPSIRQYFCSNLKPKLHPETEVQKFKGKLVNVNTTVNFVQTVKATCLTTITQCNSNNSLNELRSNKKKSFG